MLNEPIDKKYETWCEQDARWGKRAWFSPETQGRTLRKGLENGQMKCREKRFSRGKSLCKSLEVRRSLVCSRRGLKEGNTMGRQHELGLQGKQVPFPQGLVSWSKHFLFHLKCHWRVISACEVAWFMFLKDLFSNHVINTEGLWKKQWENEWVNT